MLRNGGAVRRLSAATNADAIINYIRGYESSSNFHLPLIHHFHFQNLACQSQNLNSSPNKSRSSHLLLFSHQSSPVTCSTTCRGSVVHSDLLRAGYPQSICLAPDNHAEFQWHSIPNFCLQKMLPMKSELRRQPLICPGTPKGSQV